MSCLSWRSMTEQLLRALAAQTHQLDGDHDGRQGVSQLVAQHRQELVLGAGGVLAACLAS
jgi:hypothetical protein